jgi:hypothetical protein
VEARTEPQFCSGRCCRRRTQAEHCRQTHRAAVAIHEFAQLACSVQEDQERSESFERSHLHLIRLAPSFWSYYCLPRRSCPSWITFELETPENTAVESNENTGFTAVFVVENFPPKAAENPSKCGEEGCIVTSIASIFPSIWKQNDLRTRQNMEILTVIPYSSRPDDRRSCLCTGRES